MLPVPLTVRPIAGLEFVQLKVSPPAVFAVNGIAPIAVPEQTDTSVMATTTGSGLIVIVNISRLAPVLVHPLFVAVTVIIPTISAPVKLVGAV